MSDSVSRQAVKNMVDTWTYDMMDPEDVERALHDVDDLPSTQPDIIHCRDCENLKIDGIYHDCWCDGRKVWLDFYCGNAKRKNGG